MTGLDPARFQKLLEFRSRQWRHNLRLRADPFTFQRNTVSTTGVAGVIQLTPTTELEIVPKCFRPADTGWRQDFLFMAIATGRARVFRREGVSANRGQTHAGLLSLIAEMVLSELNRLIRLPIREYRRQAWRDAEIDGELDVEELWDLHPEGFPQTGSRLSTNNPFMGIIGKAAGYLGAASTDGGVRQQLLGIASLLQAPVVGRHRSRVPGRHARWQALYDFSQDVLAGHGMELAPGGPVLAPGYLLNTERVWEEMLIRALCTKGEALGSEEKPTLTLGERYRGSSRVNPERVIATPDLVLAPPGCRTRIVVDAKYKGSATDPKTVIDRGDLYEAMGFLEAAQTRVAILIHPELNGGSAAEMGSVRPFDEVVIGQRRVIGVTVNTRGVGRSEGMSDFGNRLGQSILRIAGTGGLHGPA